MLPYCLNFTSPVKSVSTAEFCSALHKNTKKAKQDERIFQEEIEDNSTTDIISGQCRTYKTGFLLQQMRPKSQLSLDAVRLLCE